MTSIAQNTPAKRRTIVQLLPFIAKKRFVFTMTVLSGIIAQCATVTALGTGAWMVGLALTGGAAENLTSAFWILGVAVVGAALAKYYQTFVSHDFAFSLIQVLQVGIFDGL
jgi:ATP-binding cassette subfamily C protein CydCD